MTKKAFLFLPLLALMCSCTPSNNVPSGGGTGGGSGSGEGTGHAQKVDGVYNIVSKKKIEFGSYPQSEANLTDYAALTILVGELPTHADHKDWTPFDYYAEFQKVEISFYKDIEYNNNKYRATYILNFRPMNVSDPAGGPSFIMQNGFYATQLYFFKYEPIVWNIMKTNDGKMMLSTEKILDVVQYSIKDEIEEIGGVEYHPNNYARSDVRAYLNNDFYNLAFNGSQKNLIEVTTVDNSLESVMPYDKIYDDGSYAGLLGDEFFTCEDTEDKVFCLSRKELCDPLLGMCSTDDSLWEYDSARGRDTTPYSRNQGALTKDWGDDPTMGYYWLRSPKDNYTDDGFCARDCSYDGYIAFGTGVTDCYIGILPALNINLDLLNK